MLPFYSHQASKAKNHFGRETMQQSMDKNSPLGTPYLAVKASPFFQISKFFDKFLAVFKEAWKCLLKTKAKHPTYFQNENCQSVKTDKNDKSQCM